MFHQTRPLKSTVEGSGIRATARVFDVNKNTVLNWVKGAGELEMPAQITDSPWSMTELLSAKAFLW